MLRLPSRLAVSPAVAVSLHCREPVPLSRYAPRYLAKATASRLRAAGVSVSPYSGLVWVGQQPEPGALAGGEAERTVCRALQLNCTAWDFNKAPNPQASAFMRWASAAIDEGKPVIMGLYWTEERDADYDHIVPMVGYDGDAIYYNDLYSNATRRADKSAFVSTRKHCKKSADSGPSGGPAVSVSARSWRFCLPEKVDYGLIVHGNIHAEQAGLYPVRLSMGTWSEPDYSKEDKLHESPRQLSATVTVSGLTAGAHYALLWYDTPSKIPARDLLSKGGYAGMLRFTVPPAPSPSPRSSAASLSLAPSRCRRRRSRGYCRGRHPPATLRTQSRPTPRRPRPRPAHPRRRQLPHW